MWKLKVKLLAHRGAPASLFEKGKEKLSHLLVAGAFEIVETDADLLFFLSGGSERPATEVLKSGRFYVLLAYKEGNSYASATEVKAYANQQGIETILLDYEAPQTREFLKKFTRVLEGLRQLDGQRLGLIGEVSDWLIASKIKAESLQKKLGIELVRIPWSNLANFQEQDADADLLRSFQSEDFNLEDTAKVHQLLRNCVQRERLDAITVECFSLVTEHAVTACLPLAKLNADGFPAGCEGDIVSITGMMLVKAITGCVPWIANTVQVGESRSLFAHCTVALSLLKDFSIRTHFETGKGTSIQGAFEANNVVLFRLDQTLTKAFLTEAKVLKRPQHEYACRTQIEIALSPEAIESLRERPLGNHHLILPAEHAKTLSLACRVLGLEFQ